MPIAIFTLASLLGACTFFSPWTPDEPGLPIALAGSGASLVRYGSYLYVVGGQTPDGEPEPEILFASVDAAGNVGELRSAGILPEGRSFSACVAAGGFMYILGGIDSFGLSDDVLFAPIRADGTIGFSTDRHWVRDLRGLPEPRAGMSALFHDGRLLMVGGFSDRDGRAEASDEILHARMYVDGQVGQWYRSPQNIPVAGFGAGIAIRDGRLYASMGAVLSSWRIYPDFRLGSRRVEASLPRRLSGAPLLPTAEGFALAGGYVSGNVSEECWRISLSEGVSGVWSLDDTPVHADGTSWASSGGYLFTLNSTALSGGRPAIGRFALNLLPATPKIMPGSGLVPLNTAIKYESEPGTVVKYLATPYTVTDTALGEVPVSAEEISGTEISGASVFAFRTFDQGGRGSLHIESRYGTHALGFFHYIRAIIPVAASAAGAERFSMSSADTEAWYEFSGMPGSRYALYIEDGIDGAERGSLSATIYETDRYTVAIGINGLALRDIKSSSALRDFEVGPGDYYLHVKNSSATTGASFDAAILERE